MTNTAFEHVVIENALQKALKNDEFFLVYQPQYRLKDRSYIGMEVLLRWNHPDLGLVPPSRFISIAEQSGQIRMIGEWVLSKACQQGRDWLDQGYNFHRMAINISGLQLQQRDFLESFQKHLRASGLPAHYIELEITETFLMKSTQHAIDALKVIKEQGCHVSIDDFGTGYSSMAYLKKLPVTNLKVDQSFVQELPEDQDDAAITRAIIALAHALNLKVIAEGIETEAQLQFLVDIDCNYGQGYLFNKPLTVDQMTSLLSTERA